MQGSREVPRAYGWDGTDLTRWSTDQTMGQHLHRNGVAAEIAEQHDNWSRTGAAQAVSAMCREVQIPEAVHLILLVSDGVSDRVGHERMEAPCRAHAANPQTLTTAAEGYRDDATVIALAAAPTSHVPGSHRGWCGSVAVLCEARRGQGGHVAHSCSGQGLKVWLIRPGSQKPLRAWDAHELGSHTAGTVHASASPLIVPLRG